MIFIIALLASIALINAQCDGGGVPPTTCNNCLKLSNATVSCGWCAASEKCSMGNSLQPTDGSKCHGVGQWNFGQCPKCAAFNGDCRSCTLNGDCQWCPDSNTCAHEGDTTCTNGVHTCPCNLYTSCSACTLFGAGECDWCQDKDIHECVSKNDVNKCTTYAIDCPCANNMNCDSCLDDFNGHNHQSCAWCDDPATHVPRCLDDTKKGSAECPTATLACPVVEPCENHENCVTCNQAGCGWCSDSLMPSEKRCFDPAKLPNNAKCVTHCNDECAKYKSCDTCHEADCRFCKDASGNYTCSATGDGFCVHNCERFCEKITSCLQCSVMTGCGWCATGETAMCMDVDVMDGVCEAKTVCGTVDPPGEIGGVGNFFLGMLTLALIAAAVTGGYLYWRKRNGGAVYQAI